MLDACDLVTNAHRVVLHLLAHLEGTSRRLRISLLDHLTHTDLGLRLIHHFEVASDLYRISNVPRYPTMVMAVTIIAALFVAKRANSLQASCVAEVLRDGRRCRVTDRLRWHSTS